MFRRGVVGGMLYEPKARLGEGRGHELGTEPLIVPAGPGGVAA
jgi:hypothetical protein